jgi:hypothetical protein
VELTASYDPGTQKWRYLGLPARVSVDPTNPQLTSVTAGFRGSAASVMLPLKPPYNQAQFLDAGGVLGTSPGAYLANASSVIDTVTTGGGVDHFSTGGQVLADLELLDGRLGAASTGIDAPNDERVLAVIQSGGVCLL